MRPWWTVYYGDGTTVSGRTRPEWERAPDEGVQAVVLWHTPRHDERPWIGVTDRHIWTGLDWYDPFNFGEKDGKLLPHGDYEEIARRAFYEPRP